MDEFGLIETYFAPLANDFPGSLNLTDDAALIDVPHGQQLVVTKDAITEGVHFFGHEDAALIAKKLLRVNLSDLAAKGAAPLCYLLAVMLPKATQEAWIARFAQGLSEDQKLFGIHLAGGDTTSTQGGMCFSITAMGTVPHGHMLKRNGARAGEDVYVSGTIGDSALGLQLSPSPLEGEGGVGGDAHSGVGASVTPHPNPPPQGGREFLIQRYLLPEPRLALGQALQGVASACMDISDGLMQDLGHVCAASNVGAAVRRGWVPLSDAAEQCVRDDASRWNEILGGGDDYELLFTAPKEKAAEVAALAHTLSLRITKIGEMTQGSGVKLLDENGAEVAVEKKGFRHF